MTETETDQKLIVDLFLSIHISQLPKYSRQIFQLWTRGQYLYGQAVDSVLKEKAEEYIKKPADSVLKEKAKQWRRYSES